MEAAKIPGIKRAQKVYSAGEEIAGKSALEVGDIGFSSPHLLSCTLPYSKPSEIPFVRKTPWCKLTLNGLPEYGLPYGSSARLFLAYIQTEAVRTRSKEVVLAPTLYEAARRVGVGTDSRSVKRFKNQLLACFAATWMLDLKRGGVQQLRRLSIASTMDFRYDLRSPNQVELWEPRFRLSQDFYELLIDRRIPFDLRALKALSRSPLGMDLYTWLVVTAPSLERKKFIPYTWLMRQWGTGFSPGDKQARKNFRRKVERELRNVYRLWPELRAEPMTVLDRHGKVRSGLEVHPSSPHVAKVTSA